MRPPYRSILCPTDLSPVGDQAVALAYALAGPGTTVHLLHVNPPAVAISPIDGTYVQTFGPTASARAAVERKVGARLSRLAPKGSRARRVRTDVRVVDEPDPAAAIAAEAKRTKADAIVMGTHGRSGIGKLLLGSVATDVLKTSRASVILVRDRARARPRARS